MEREEAPGLDDSVGKLPMVIWSTTWNIDQPPGIFLVCRFRPRYLRAISTALPPPASLRRHRAQDLRGPRRPLPDTRGGRAVVRPDLRRKVEPSFVGPFLVAPKGDHQTRFSFFGPFHLPETTRH